MTDDRSLERAARSFIEPGPTRAPEAAVEAALRTIQTTPQERDLRILRRDLTMNTLTRILAVGAAAAAVIIAAVAVAPRLGDSSTGAPTPTRPATATTGPASPSGQPPLPNGTYRSAPIPVADIMRRLDASSLTASEKSTIINTVLRIDGATTLQVEISIRDDSFTLAYGVDGEALRPEIPWKLYVLDPTTIALDVGASSTNIQAWAVTHIGGAFTLRTRSAAPEPVEAFVRSVLFESTPFSPTT
jgi:hypothetical protein